MSITKLSKDSQNFINKISLEGSKSPVTILAIAKVIAYDLELPTTKVDNLTLYFNNTVRISIEEMLYRLNEIVLIDVKTVMEYINNFYSFRYFNVFPINATIAINPATGIVDYFGISRFFDPTTIELIKNESGKLTVYHNAIKNIMTELGE